MWNKTKTIFLTVITCTACLWLFQFPFAVSLIKPSLPNALHFEFLLFLAVLLILLWNCWKGSVSTHCSGRQCDIRERPTGRDGGTRVRSPASRWVRAESGFGKWRTVLSLPLKVQVLFLCSSLFLIKNFLDLFFHQMTLNLFVKFIFTKTGKPVVCTSVILLVIPTRQFEFTYLNVRLRKAYSLIA